MLVYMYEFQSLNRPFLPVSIVGGVVQQLGSAPLQPLLFPPFEPCPPFRPFPPTPPLAPCPPLEFWPSPPFPLPPLALQLIVVHVPPLPPTPPFPPFPPHTLGLVQGKVLANACCE